MYIMPESLQLGFRAINISNQKYQHTQKYTYHLKRYFFLQVYHYIKFTSYLSTRCAQGAIRRDSHCVQEASVTNVVGLQLAVGQVPHLRAKDIQFAFTPP